MSVYFKKLRLAVAESSGKSRLYYQLAYWFEDVLHKLFVRPFNKLKQILQWSVFLLNDYDYDWACILLVLKYKLKRTRENIFANDIVESAPKIAEEIKQCEDAIDRIIACEYFDTEVDAIYAELDKCMSRSDRFSKPWPDGLKEKLMDLHRKQEQAMEDDMEFLFQSLKNNIRGWWD